MKKIVYLSIIVLTILFIYIITRDTKVYYLALGDDLTVGRINASEISETFPSRITKYLKENNIHETTITEFANIGYRTTDLLNDIKDNKKILINNKNISIKHAIIKADVITLSIGLNDFINYISDYNLLSKNIINLKKDMEKLLKEIRNISKEKIVLIGIYNPDISNKRLANILLELNGIYQNIALQYNIYYLSIFKEIEHYINNNDYFPDDKGYTFLSKKLLTYIESDIII